MLNDYEVKAEKIREILIEKLAINGDSHLASNLGVVELMLALFSIYDFKKDKMIFDIGHQRSPYMMLYNMIEGGELKYPHEDEQYDLTLYPGFAGTASSVAMGYALSRSENKAIALVGDGSLTCGEIFEGLNHIGEQGGNVLVILNQNEMSISPNVGALADGKSVKQFFESLKFEYIGELDGHNVDDLVSTLEDIKKKKHPVVLHVRTVKGKGYSHAEKEPLRFHHPFYPFNKQTGEFEVDNYPWKKIATEAMGCLEKKFIEYEKKLNNIYFTVPATPALNQIKQHAPSKVVDTGINEQHCMTFSTVLAELGNTVFLTMNAIFLSRCYSQIMDLCHQGANLKVILNMPGVTPYGSTHQSTYVIGMLKAIPNLTLLHPANMREFEQSLDYSLTFDGPLFIQVPKENVSMYNPLDGTFVPGKGQTITKGESLTVLPIGSTFETALAIANNFAGVEVINPRFLKPLDDALILGSIEKTKRVLILEEGFKKGGIGEEVLAKIKERDIACQAKIVAAEDLFSTCAHVDYARIKREFGLQEEVCFNAANALLAHDNKACIEELAA